MAPIRMIAFDLDGTMLRSDKTVSPLALEALRLAGEADVLRVVATARPVRAVREWLPALPFDAGIFHNGAVILLPDGTRRELGVGDAAPLVRAFLRFAPACRLGVESMDRLFANFDAGEIWPGIAFTRTADFAELHGDPAEKLLLAEPPAKLEAFRALLPPELYLEISEATLGMVLRRGATKENALRRLAEALDLPLAAAASFGDDVNDIGMLRAAGIGVAMQNAPENVRAAADEVCASNDEDGAARWILARLGGLDKPAGRGV